MTSRLNPYLNFTDNARDAMTFYQTVFAGELTMTTFAEGGMSPGPDDADKIMHAQLLAPNGFCLMASDAPPGMPLSDGSSMSVSLSGTDEAELRGYWDKLADGADITMPIAPSPWGAVFGMLTDKFSTAWLVNIDTTGH